MISSITQLYPVAQNCTKRAVGSSSKPVSFQESLQSSRAARDRVETRLSDGKLSAEELAVLSEKYDPDHMTQEQYDAFLDELESKGILSKEDKMLVKNPEMRFGEAFEPHGISTGRAYIEDDALMQLKSLQEYDGNASLFVKAMLAHESALAERTPPLKEDRQRMAALRVVSDVLKGLRI